LPHFFGFNLFS
jgi:hypothetical protein